MNKYKNSTQKTALKLRKLGESRQKIKPSQKTSEILTTRLTSSTDNSINSALTLNKKTIRLFRPLHNSDNSLLRYNSYKTRFKAKTRSLTKTTVPFNLLNSK